MMKESWWTMADLTDLYFFSKQDFFDLTKLMSSCAAQLLKKYFKNKKARLEVSQLRFGSLIVVLGRRVSSPAPTVIYIIAGEMDSPGLERQT